MTPSLEGWPTKAKEPCSLHEVRLTWLDTNPVFQCLGEDKIKQMSKNVADATFQVWKVFGSIVERENDTSIIRRPKSVFSSDI